MRTCVVFALLAAGLLQAHDLITTPITWSREISRIVNAKCANCHREEGRAFSLTTYRDARPWAVAIKEETLRRSMPPWGAVKGFGDFRNDIALTPEELELIVSWVEGGVPEGDPAELPERLPAAAPAYEPGEGIVASGEFHLAQPLTLDAIVPRKVPAGASIQITAQLPDGSIQPLVWLQDYKEEFSHPFLLRKPLELPKGAILRGIPAGASIEFLMPAREPEIDF